MPFARMTTAGAEYNGERLLNWLARPTPGGVGQISLMARSGLSSVSNPTDEPVRAMTKMAGDIYFVAGGAVWKYVVSSGATTNVGIVGDGVTSIAASGTEVAIVTRNTYYICNGTATTPYSTGALTSPRYVVFQDGYFIVSGTVAGRSDGLTVSGLDDGTTFGALDFAFAENSPDEVRGMISDHGRLYVFGEETIESFWNAGNAAFPFAPAKSEVMEAGCFEGATVAKLDNAVYWVDADKTVQRTFGASPEVVSTPEVKEALDASTVEGAFTFTDRGTKIYAITRRAATTLCLDVSSGAWHERSTGLDDAPWTATDSIDLGGVTYFGTDAGQLCTSTTTDVTDAGALIEREAISVPRVEAGNAFSIPRLELMASCPNSATVSDPKIIMQTSRNGKEWGTEKWRSLGGIGEYDKLIAWTGLGRFERRAQVRFRVTDAVAVDLYGIAMP